MFHKLRYFPYVAVAFALGCDKSGARATDQETPRPETATAANTTMPGDDYPLHGLVSGTQLTIRKRPDPNALKVGWLRIGSRVRLKEGSKRTSNCQTGWYNIFPEGWVCAGQGIEVGKRPPSSGVPQPPPDRDASLPYDYWYVKDPMTPEFHRLPSRDEQRAARAFANRYLELLEKDEDKAARFRAEELPGQSTKRPAVVHRYLHRGYFVAGVGEEVRAFRTFVRTPRQRYVKKYHLLQRNGSDFRGVVLSPSQRLPIVWAVRTAQPLIKKEEDDGSIRWRKDPDAKPIDRYTIITSWKGRKNIGGRHMHVLDGDRYLRDWFAAVASPIPKPAEIKSHERWVHVNLQQQTLVLYEGKQPVYATLVSTGLDGHNTPTGTFTVQKKFVADTMADLGAGLEDRYSIEDVPWAQYFEKAVALHGAFWHDRFGLQRSHGCVNLAPKDAKRVFEHLNPRVPLSWLGVSTFKTIFRSSHVHVTAN